MLFPFGVWKKRRLWWAFSLLRLRLFLMKKMRSAYLGSLILFFASWTNVAGVFAGVQTEREAEKRPICNKDDDTPDIGSCSCYKTEVSRSLVAARTLDIKRLSWARHYKSVTSLLLSPLWSRYFDFNCLILCRGNFLNYHIWFLLDQHSWLLLEREHLPWLLLLTRGAWNNWRLMLHDNY